jgi:hypothetical protein
LAITNSTKLGLALNLGLPSETPITDHLSHGTTCSWLPHLVQIKAAFTVTATNLKVDRCMTVDENYILPRQCAVKPVTMTDTLTEAEVVMATVNPSCQYFLQHCKKIKEDMKYVKNYLRC